MNIFSNITASQKLKDDVADPEVRQLMIDAHIRQGLPLQLRAMREDRGWTQAVLAEKLGTTQNAISRFESPKAAPPTIPTLKRIAQAFDVALIVKFAPFSEFIDSVSNMSGKSVAVPSYDVEAEEEATTNRDL
jgi:transcriptional regulator with XRE-family HTH domain